MSVAKQFADYLAASGVGTLGTNLFISRMPDSPDACVVVTPTGGYEPDMDIAALRTPTMQVRVRAVGFETANTKSESIFALLHGQNNVQMGTTKVLYCKAMGEPIYIGKDVRDREEFTVNFVLHIIAGG